MILVGQSRRRKDSVKGSYEESDPIAQRRFALSAPRGVAIFLSLLLRLVVHVPMETEDSIRDLRVELAELMKHSDELLALLAKVRERLAVVLARLNAGHVQDTGKPMEEKIREVRERMKGTSRTRKAKKAGK